MLSQADAKADWKQNLKLTLSSWIFRQQIADAQCAAKYALSSTIELWQHGCALSKFKNNNKSEKNSECQLFSDNLKLQIRILTNPIKILYPTQLFSSKCCKNVHRGPETNQLSNSNHTISQKIVTKPIWRCHCQLIWRIWKFFKNIVCIKR